MPFVPNFRYTFRGNLRTQLRTREAAFNDCLEKYTYSISQPSVQPDYNSFHIPIPELTAVNIIKSPSRETSETDVPALSVKSVARLWSTPSTSPRKSMSSDSLITEV